jgi:hypothetical protein
MFLCFSYWIRAINWNTQGKIVVYGLFYVGNQATENTRKAKWCKHKRVKEMDSCGAEVSVSDVV